MENSKENWELAKVCVSASNCAYLNPTLITKNENAFYIGTYKDFKIISFRGSYTLSNWIDDAEAIRVFRTRFSYVHNGFIDAWEDMRDEIKKRISKDDKLILCGHSYGAAISCLAALDCYLDGFNVIKILTQGNPRVGGEGFKKIFNESHLVLYRFVDGADLVTDVPLGLGYEHVGEPIYMGYGGKLLTSQQSPWTWKFWTITLKRLLDHKIENYIEMTDLVFKNLFG